MQETKQMQVQSLVGKIPWRRAWQPTPIFLPEKPHGQRSLASYSPKGCRELDTTEQLRTHISSSGYAYLHTESRLRSQRTKRKWLLGHIGTQCGAEKVTSPFLEQRRGSVGCQVKCGLELWREDPDSSLLTPTAKARPAWCPVLTPLVL